MISPVSGSIAETSLQGMQSAEAQLNTAASHVAQLPAGPQNGQGGDVVDLSAEMVALMSARDNFLANIGAAKAGDEMQRALLNLVA